MKAADYERTETLELLECHPLPVGSYSNVPPLLTREQMRANLDALIERIERVIDQAPQAPVVIVPPGFDEWRDSLPR